ncbi:hypothetical protein E6R18_21765 [Streptomyces sp. A1277]|uniref:DUF5988 family protein n=1 Tax=Streptomyces sp. A1277 TaxID=2563103 RepID=UPI0010A20C74|nr:DUF5988 family protein [Streptomyces sp. A1277]THA30082.1 hypothetical protein E6R18_21765 [Streptomyces sp. A1277]
MSGSIERTDNERKVLVELVGGPADLPQAQRRLHIDADRAQQKIKIKYYGGYQHFEPSDEAGGNAGQSSRTFRWTGFTKIAE